MIKNVIKGDLFSLFEKENPDSIKIIPHVCNDIGAWGAGFVIPLAKHFPKAKQDYQEYVDAMQKAPISDDILGDTVFTKIPPKILIANMIAQKGIGTAQKPIRYGALVRCMETVRKTAKTIAQSGAPVEIHMPKFGSGLAGGSWDLIQELVIEIWQDFPVYIYYV